MKFFQIIFISIIIITSCQKQTQMTEKELVEFHGFGFVKLVGDCNLIEFENQLYKPVNLPDNLKVENQRVKITFKLTDENISNDCGDYPKIELIEIIPYRG